MKESILSTCKQYIEGDKQLHFGYIVPGHGKKGKQVEITSDDDLREMYPKYKRVTKIVLWMKQTVITTRKRSRTPTESHKSDLSKRSRTSTDPESSASGGFKAGRSNYDKHIEKTTVVDEICDELSDKHGDKIIYS